MSENKESVNSSSPLTRKIGVGLTRTNLSPGSRNVSQRSPRDRPLLTPSRLIISGSSLGTSRTNSDSYASGYNRLGGLKNISAPNVSSNILGSSSLNRPLRKLDIDKVQEPSLRKNLSATNTEELLKNDQVLSGVNVQRSQSANRGYFSPSRFSQTDRTVGLAAYKPTKQDEIIHDVSETTSTKIENYDLDLEQDEEDAIVEVKDSVDGAKKISVEVTSPSSPRKDSGYNSPRTDPNMEPFNSSVLGSRSHIKSYTVGSESPSDFQSSLNNSSYKPERPVRSKHSAKKKSIDQPVLSPKNIDQSEHLSQSIDKSVTLSQTSSTQSPWQHGNNTIQYDTNLADMVKNKEINSEYNLSRKNQLEDSVSEDIDQRSRSHFVEKSESQGEVDEENTPVAKPRVHRRRTRRSISFRHLEEDEYIGFASLPEQVHRKAVRRGFEFTLMVVGETGLGKSTLINSLFLMDLYKDRKVENIEERIQKTVELEKKELEIEERGVKLKLTIVDTPGFNDAVNAEESWKPIGNYIDKQFETYFTAESGLNRKNIQDTRVHCCLYFISPYGHGLRPVDIMVMKKLHHKVNIIPLIAKSDMLTKPEVKRLKEQVLKEIEKHSIDIYQYPECDSDEDEEFKQQDKQLKNSIPFAVVSSNTVVEAGGKKIRGRMYPWGIVEVENPVHSDFIKLRQMLISTHMQDLKDVTCDVHYENYRAEHISEQMTGTQRERGKLKRDSAANLEASLATEKLLQEKEAEIKRMQEMLAKMQAQLQTTSPRANGRVGHV